MTSQAFLKVCQYHKNGILTRKKWISS